MNDKPIIHASFKSLANPIVTKCNGNTYSMILTSSMKYVIDKLLKEYEK
jgi:hypothetical protein